MKKYGVFYKFAKAMGFSERTLSLKLNNKRYWKQQDISKAVELLDIRQTDIQEYFFKLKLISAENQEGEKSGNHIINCNNNLFNKLFKV